MRKKIIVLFVLRLLLFETLEAQNEAANLQQVISPSPNASSIQKFGSWPVGYSTGIPNINIPLFELQSGKLKLPVSMAYHAGGLRVNDIGSSTGMGWSLIAGGTINRTIMGGQPDERTTYGYWHTYPIQTHLPNDPAFEYYRVLSYAAGAYDSQPDIFSYSFDAYSGKFVFDTLRNIFTIPYNNLRIKETKAVSSYFNPYTQGSAAEGITGFTITAPDGTVYQFFEPELTNNTIDNYDKFLGLTSPTDVSEVANNELKNNYINTWLLSRIVSADTKDTISFEYDAFEIQYKTPGASSMGIAAQLELMGDAPQQLNSYFNRKSIVKNKMQSKLLKKIVFKNGYVQFYNTSSRKDLTGGKKLDSVSLFNVAGAKIKGYAFNYKYLKAADLLTEDQLNLGDAPDILRLFLSTLNESGKNSQLLPPYQFDYEHSLPVHAKNIEGSDYWGLANGRQWEYLGDSIPPISNGLWVNTYQAFDGEMIGVLKQPVFNYAKQGVLTGIQYPTGGNTQFTYEPNISDGTNTVSIPYLDCDGGGTILTNADFISDSIVGKFRVRTNQFLPFADITFSLLPNFDSFPSYYTVQIIDSATNQIVHTFGYVPPNPAGSCTSYNPSPYPSCIFRVGLPASTYYIKAKHNGQTYQSMFPPEELNFCYITIPPFNCRVGYKLVDDPVSSGGLRIKQIRDIDAVTGKGVTRKYEYAEPFRPEPLGKYMTETFHDFCGSRQVDIVVSMLSSHEGQKILSSSSAYSLVDLNGGYVKYGFVKETLWDEATQKSAGYTSYKFNVLFDGPEFMNFKFMPYPPFTGDSWMVGQPESKMEWKVTDAGE